MCGKTWLKAGLEVILHYETNSLASVYPSYNIHDNVGNPAILLCTYTVSAVLLPQAAVPDLCSGLKMLRALARW